MLTKRKAGRLYVAARRAYANGQHWEGGHQVAAPDGTSPLRIAFEAGRKAERARQRDATPSLGMPVEVWALVYADWLSR